MKIVFKFTIFLIVGILLVHAGSVLVRVRREQAFFQEDISRDSRVLGRALGYAVELAWLIRGEKDAIDIINHANEKESNVFIRWVWLNAKPGEDNAPSVTLYLLEPLKKGTPVVARFGKGEGALYTYTPVRVPSEKGLGAIEIADPLADERRYLLESIRNASITAGIVVTLCAISALFLGVVVIGRPVRRLVEQARAIGRGELDHRLALPVKDELGELAGEMDNMCNDLLQARENLKKEVQSKIAAIDQLRHADRLMTVGTLASGIAHQLGTPINVIDGHAQLIKEDGTAGNQAKNNADIISRQCKRMTRIIRDLLDFSRRGGHKGSSVDAREAARETLRMLELLTHKQDIETFFDEGESDVNVCINFHQLQQVLTNILINSLHAMPDGGRLDLRVGRGRATRPGSGQVEAEYVKLGIEDTGVGMDSETLGRIFEPFFTTKDVGEGTGLGLSVAHGIIDDHGGWIDVTSEQGKGTKFDIYLPPENVK
jgi:two-component system NtrC family sensor kinase